METETAAVNVAPAAEAESVDPWSTPLPPEEGEPAGTAAVATEGDEPAKTEGNPKAEKPAIPEAELRAAALKFANGTMAAARRAERAVATTKAENDRLKSAAQSAAAELAEFKAEFKKNPFGAVRKLGYAGIKEFVDAGIEVGEPKTETADDRVARLEAKLAERDAAAAKAEQAATHEAAKGRVWAALEAIPDKYDAAVNTTIGRNAVWEGITEYARIHGSVSDAAVYRIAADVEAELNNDISKARRFQSASPASTGKATATTANAVRTGGRTITNTSTGGAPAVREYSTDWDEGRKQIMEDMRANGEI